MPGDACDGLDRLAEQIAVVQSCAPAERAHRGAQLGLHDRVDDHRRAALHPVDGEVQVLLRLDARVPDLDELLIGELRLEREDEARGGLARRVGDDVELDRCRRGGHRARDPSPRDRVDAGAGERDEVVRRELDLEAAPARADHDPLVVARGGVEVRRQALALADRADAAGHVAGGALRLCAVGHPGALPERLQVELRRDGDAGDRELAVDRDDERLEDAGRVDAELLCSFEPVRLSRRVVLVLVQRERDACPLGRCDCGRRRHTVQRSQPSR